MVQGSQRQCSKGAQAKLIRFLYDLTSEVLMHHFLLIPVKRVTKASPDSRTEEFDFWVKTKHLEPSLISPIHLVPLMDYEIVTLKKNQVIKIFKDAFKNRGLRRLMFWLLRTFLTFLVISGIQIPTQ